jgi:hypothetical protein
MLVFEAMIESNSSADLRPIQVLIFESRLHLRPISSFAFSCTYNWLLGLSYTDRAEARCERKNGEEDERERVREQNWCCFCFGEEDERERERD